MDIKFLPNILMGSIMILNCVVVFLFAKAVKSQPAKSNLVSQAPNAADFVFIDHESSALIPLPSQI